jgi:hypothetical protein
MAIQKIIDQDGIPPIDGSGRRAPLGIVVQPSHQMKPQPVGLTIS